MCSASTASGKSRRVVEIHSRSWRLPVLFQLFLRDVLDMRPDIPLKTKWIGHARHPVAIELIGRRTQALCASRNSLRINGIAVLDVDHQAHGRTSIVLDAERS